MRLGDLIQSTPLLRVLRCKYPEARLTMVVQDVFQGMMDLIPFYDRLVVFPSLKVMPILDHEITYLPEAFSYLADFCRQLQDPPPDLVINLTPNKVGAIMSFLTEGRESQGLTLKANRHYDSPASWTSYLLCSSKHRAFNTFNVVDQFTRLGRCQPDRAGVNLTIPLAVQQQVDQELTGLGVNPNSWLIGLQPGASTINKQWPPEYFAQTGRLLLQEHPCHFLILGTKTERHLGEAIQAQLPAGSTTSLMGETTIASLGAYLKRLGLLITNDTGTMHLACGVDTRVLALFLTTRVYDTGPTGKGHLALQPRLDCYPCHSEISCPYPHCHHSLPPKAVAHLATRLLKALPLETMDDGPLWHNLDIYTSDYDDHGYQTYRPLIQRPLVRNHFWLEVMKAGWRIWLDGELQAVEPTLRSIKKYFTRNFLCSCSDLGVAAGRAALQELITLAARGEQLSRKILPLAAQPRRNLVHLKKLGEGLPVLDSELTRLGGTFPEIASIMEMFFLAQRSIPESDLPSMTRQTIDLYNQLVKQGRLLLEILGGLQELENKGPLLTTPVFLPGSKIENRSPAWNIPVNIDLNGNGTNNANLSQ